MTRRQWRTLSYVDADHRGWRQLAAAMLLQSCDDAHAGDYRAVHWLHSDQARTWAELLDLPQWPPQPEQLANRTELARRSRAPLAEPEGPLGKIQSRNPADQGDPWTWPARDDDAELELLPILAQWEAV